MVRITLGQASRLRSNYVRVTLGDAALPRRHLTGRTAAAGAGDGVSDAPLRRFQPIEDLWRLGGEGRSEHSHARIARPFSSDLRLTTPPVS